MKKLLIPLIFAFNLTNFAGCHTKPTDKGIEKENVVNRSISPPPEWVDTSKILPEEVLLHYISSSNTVIPNPNNGVPFNKLDYDKVIAYDFAGSEEPYPSVIDEKGKFVPVILGQQFLTQVQADKVLSTLTRKSTYGETTAACFRPHFALVLYKNNKKVNQVNICLDCNYLIADIEIPALTHKKVNKGTKEEYSMIGFTGSGKSAIIDLCKQLNFNYGREEDK